MKIRQLIHKYLKHQQVLGRSFYTIKGTRSCLNKLIQFLESERIPDIQDLTNSVLKDYQEELAFSLTNKGRPLTSRTQARILGVIKGFTKYLKTEDYLIHDPGAAIKLPKKPGRLPKVILSTEEVTKLLKAPDIRTNRGYRNRIILEILYDTAIRRSEVTKIKLTDIDPDSGYIRITGKGDKDRVVPLSRRVCGLINNYIMCIRPYLLQDKDPGYLILNRWGRQMDPNSIWAVVKRCVHLSGIKKNISTHTFRHTCATHMLRNGAPVRHIQEMLGHESLESTQIYTHVTINDLKEIHARYHPSSSTEV